MSRCRFLIFGLWILFWFLVYASDIKLGKLSLFFQIFLLFLFFFLLFSLFNCPAVLGYSVLFYSISALFSFQFERRCPQAKKLNFSVLS